MQPTVGARLVAWGGALLFLAALVSTSAAFLLRWGPATPTGPAWPAALANVAIFSAFALHHSICARLPVRAAIRRLTGDALERSAYVWLASALLLAVCAAWVPVPGLWWEMSGPAAWAARAIQVCGVGLTVAGARAIDVLELVGLRQAEGPLRAGGIPAVFRTTGVYGLVRHPIYFGWVLMVWAEPTMTATRGVFAAISCLYLIVAIPLEERSLAATAGPAYAAYRRQVRARLLPFIW